MPPRSVRRHDFEMTMRLIRFAFTGLAAIAALGLASRPSASQRASRYPASSTPDAASMFDVTPYAGYILFGNYIGPLSTGITNAPAPIIGV